MKKLTKKRSNVWKQVFLYSTALVLFITVPTLTPQLLTPERIDIPDLMQYTSVSISSGSGQTLSVCASRIGSLSGRSLYADVTIGGSIETENEFQFKGPDLQRNLNTLSLIFEYATGNYHLFACPELSVSGLIDVSDASGLQDIEQIYPCSLQLKEAYVDIYEFLIPVMDVRIGKQIVVWGTGDRINPTTNLCPLDLSNFFDFGERLGVDAISANLYLGCFNLTGIYSPVFTPALLPQNFEEMAGISLGQNTLTLPDQTLGESSQLGLRLNWQMFNYDISASYYYGRYSIPAVSKMTMNLLGWVESSKSFFPRVQVAGLDCSGSISNIGIWGEAAYFMPEDYTTDAYLGKNLISEQSASPYFHYIIGSDYTFGSGVYVNIQFIHGFDHEIVKDQLNDYIITRIEKSFFSDKLKIMPCTVVFSAHEWSSIADSYGFAYIPEVEFHPVDNLEFDIGSYIIYGKGSSLFANLKDDDALFCNVKVQF